MHGLVNRSIQAFLVDTYGPDLWNRLAAECGVGADGFEAMLHYDDKLTHKLLDATADALKKSRDMLLEDLGTYLVSNPSVEGVRRLLRFGGETYVDFLHSLDELNGRAQLAVVDLEVPQLELHEDGFGQYCLTCRWSFPGAAALMTGILRGMADDYGALVIMDTIARDPHGNGVVKLELLDSGHAEGRSFQLAANLG